MATQNEDSLGNRAGNLCKPMLAKSLVVVGAKGWEFMTGSRRTHEYVKMRTTLFKIN